MQTNIVHTPHDRFFRASMSDPRVAKEFFESHLPKNIQALANLNTLELCSGTFVDEELQLKTSDALFSLEWQNKPGYLYSLVEHQSSPDPLMAFRTIKYTLKIMEQHHKETEKLPIVYVLVLYNGDRKYPYSTDFFDLFGEDKGLAQQILFKPFDLVDLSQISDEKLKHKSWAGMLELSLKHGARQDLVLFIQNVIEQIKVIDQARGTSYLTTIFNYLFTVGEASSLGTLRQVIHSNLSIQQEENLMTVAQQLRQEGRQEGREEVLQELAITLAPGENIMTVAQQLEQKGHQRGRQETLEEFAIKLVNDNLLPDDKISSLTGLSLQAIAAMRAELAVH